MIYIIILFIFVFFLITLGKKKGFDITRWVLECELYILNARIFSFEVDVASLLSQNFPINHSNFTGNISLTKSLDLLLTLQYIFGTIRLQKTFNLGKIYHYIQGKRIDLWQEHNIYAIFRLQPKNIRKPLEIPVRKEHE